MARDIKNLVKAIRRANRQAEIELGMVGRFRSKTILSKKREESRNKCRGKVDPTTDS